MLGLLTIFTLFLFIMKTKLLFTATLLTMLAIFTSQAQRLTVATYNMRNDNNAQDSMSGNGWKQRYPVIASLVRFHDFDIFGTQECLYHQLENIKSELPGYTYVGIGRDDGKQAGEFSAIYYKTERFTPLEKGDFWLSETPDKPSLGWDAKCCKRICSWVYLQDKKSKAKFYVFNAHYDHQGIVARNESSKLVLKKIKEIAGDAPAIFMGDLNGGMESDWYKLLADSKMLKDAYYDVKYPYAPNGSFNGFGSNTDSNQIIDHIFVTKQFMATKWGILTDTYHGKYPSDHFPVEVQLEMKP